MRSSRNVRPTCSLAFCVLDALQCCPCPKVLPLNWQRFLEIDILVKELSLETPIYVISEGHEPPFFTRFFEWDSSKANVSGSFSIMKLHL